MAVYVQQFLMWLIFMVLIAGITLLVPKIAKPIERWINEKRSKMQAEKEADEAAKLKSDSDDEEQM